MLLAVAHVTDHGGWRSWTVVVGGVRVVPALMRLCRSVGPLCTGLGPARLIRSSLSGGSERSLPGSQAASLRLCLPVRHNLAFVGSHLSLGALIIWCPQMVHSRLSGARRLPRSPLTLLVLTIAPAVSAASMTQDLGWHGQPHPRVVDVLESRSKASSMRSVRACCRG